jgi:ubiquinone/menaquinone biosynthesis C-methylase UbiE
VTRSLDPYGAIDRQRQPHGYVEHLEARGRTPAQRRLRRRFLRFARIGRGQRVLEIGSGTASSPAMPPPPRPSGRDHRGGPEPVMTQAARRLARAGGFGSRLVHAVGDGARLRFAADSFDRVFAVTVLLHVANSSAILQEMVRVARPGGLITAARTRTSAP